jgi:hypothetical protein
VIQFAEDQDNPFADVRADPTLRMGSYGIHINAQQDLLEQIVKAKTYAKAVKADDAAVPVHLWNDWIRMPAGTKEETRDAALDAFRTLGHRWFLKGLIRDAITYICETYKTGWARPRRAKDGELTKFGKDQEAIAGILWHSIHTSWFEYHAGSRLVFFRFVKQY